MRTDRLDLYSLHWRGSIPLEQTLEAFSELQQAGKIRHWGVSNFDARRTYIEKKYSTKKRPLGIPSWSDKLLEEVLRLILDAYYDPVFQALARFSARPWLPHRSAGGLPRLGGNSLVHRVRRGSVLRPTLAHDVLVGILAERIHDGRFLRLIAALLKPGIWRNGGSTSR